MNTIIENTKKALVPSSVIRTVPKLSDYVVEKMPYLIWQKETIGQFYSECVALFNDDQVIDALNHIDSQKEKELALLDLKFLDAACFHNSLPRIEKLARFIRQFSKELDTLEVLTYEELIIINPIGDMRTFSENENRYYEVMFYIAHNNYEIFAEEIIEILQSVLADKDLLNLNEVHIKLSEVTISAREQAMFLRSENLDKDAFVRFRKFLASRPDLDCLGPSGAFTATIPVIDLLYSGNHLPEDRLKFFCSNLHYYPRSWQVFISESVKEIREKIFIDLIDLSNKDVNVSVLCEVCSKFLLAFRKGHHHMVMQHIPGVANDSEPGTMGGEPPGSFLKKRIDETPKF